MAEAETRVPAWARALGLVLTVACLAFVGWRIATSGAWELERLTSPRGLSVLAAASIVYAAVCGLLVLAWRRVLTLLAEASDGSDDEPPGEPAAWLPSLAACLRIYGHSQLAKYLPGNVFHLAGRQVLAMRAGVPATRAGLSLALEHAALVVAASVLALALPSAWAPVDGPWLSAAVVAALALGAAALPLLLQTEAVQGLLPRLHLPPLSPRRTLAVWMQTIGLHLLFFLGVGLLLLALARLLGAAASPALVFAFAPAWLVGLVTPGAAAGVGVRETVLILLLGAAGLGAADALLAALALRLVTTAGDLVFFAVAAATREVGDDG